MSGYKRNQALEAISVTLGQGRSPSLALHTEIRRLLDTDRSLGRSGRSKDPERANYAFFSGEAPGRGAEVFFSSYEAFALLKALDLMHHGWPQATAVKIMRQARPVLEPKHDHILRLDPAELFDERRIREINERGHAMVSTTYPLYLVISSRKGRPSQTANDETREVAVLENDEVMRFLLREAGISSTVMALTKQAYDLQVALSETKPSKRGRGGA